LAAPWRDAESAAVGATVAEHPAKLPPDLARLPRREAGKRARAGAVAWVRKESGPVWAWETQSAMVWPEYRRPAADECAAFPEQPAEDG